MAVTFEGMERRMPKIEKCLAEYGIANLEEARKICNDLGFDPYDIVKGVQPIAFENNRTNGIVLVQLFKRFRQIVQHLQVPFISHR